MPNEILVIGSSGYLGQRVTQLLQASQNHNQIIPTHRSSSKFSGSLFYDFYQESRLPIDPAGMTVVLAAAVEMNQPADKLAGGMRTLLEQIAMCRFIYVSSDAVFSGVRGNYTEDDEPDSTNDYGTNLVLCEQLVQEMVGDHCIVRPSYIFGFVNGQLDSRLAHTRDALLAEDEVKAYNNYYKCPLSVHEVAGAIAQLVNFDYNGPLHVAGPRMDGYQFRHEAMTALGIDTKHLRSVPMPDDPTLMPDTSLDSSRWWTMAGSKPLSIQDALAIEPSH